jgi:hypothetical protein
MNTDKLKRMKKIVPKINIDALVYTCEEDYE